MGHLYTADGNAALAQGAAAYEFEGITGWVSAVPAPGLVPMYAAHKPSTKGQLLTVSKAQLVWYLTHEGYQNQGVCCYVSENSSGQKKALMSYYAPQTGDHLYTTNWAEAVNASNNLGYNLLGTVCYIDEVPVPGTVPLNRLVWVYDTFASVNMIAVAGDVWTDEEWGQFLECYSGSAQLYRRYGLRLRLAGTFYTPSAETLNQRVIDNSVEGYFLLSGWNGPEGAVDVFGTGIAGSSAGRSPIGGPCDHDAKNSGVLVEYRSVPRNLIMAHELGHYFGLSHRNDNQDNLMYERASLFGAGNLLPWEVNKVKSHCNVGWY